MDPTISSISATSYGYYGTGAAASKGKLGASVVSSGTSAGLPAIDAPIDAPMLISQGHAKVAEAASLSAKAVVVENPHEHFKKQIKILSLLAEKLIGLLDKQKDAEIIKKLGDIVQGNHSDPHPGLEFNPKAKLKTLLHLFYLFFECSIYIDSDKYIQLSSEFHKVEDYRHSLVQQFVGMSIQFRQSVKQVYKKPEEAQFIKIQFVKSLKTMDLRFLNVFKLEPGNYVPSYFLHLTSGVLNTMVDIYELFDLVPKMETDPLGVSCVKEPNLKYQGSVAITEHYIKKKQPEAALTVIRQLFKDPKAVSSDVIQLLNAVFALYLDAKQLEKAWALHKEFNMTSESHQHSLFTLLLERIKLAEDSLALMKVRDDAFNFLKSMDCVNRRNSCLQSMCYSFPDGFDTYLDLITYSTWQLDMLFNKIDLALIEGDTPNYEKYFQKALQVAKQASEADRNRCEGLKKLSCFILERANNLKHIDQVLSFIEGIQDVQIRFSVFEKTFEVCVKKACEAYAREKMAVQKPYDREKGNAVAVPSIQTQTITLLTTSIALVTTSPLSATYMKYAFKMASSLSRAYTGYPISPSGHSLISKNYFTLVNAYRQQGNLTEAIRWLNKIIQEEVVDGEGRADTIAKAKREMVDVFKIAINAKAFNKLIAFKDLLPRDFRNQALSHLTTFGNQNPALALQYLQEQEQLGVCQDHHEILYLSICEGFIAQRQARRARDLLVHFQKAPDKLVAEIEKLEREAATLSVGAKDDKTDFKQAPSSDADKKKE